jgi:hypothetical protein
VASTEGKGSGRRLLWGVLIAVAAIVALVVVLQIVAAATLAPG